MKKAKLLVMALCLSLALTGSFSFACSAVYVGKDASTDGTTIIARSEDQGSGAYNKMFEVVPASNKAGRFMVDTGEEQKGFKVALPKKTYRYYQIPDYSKAGDGTYPGACTNEYGMSITGTVTAYPSKKFGEADPFVVPGLREAILPELIACQSKTAKEGVEKMAKLIDKYGSEEGNVLMLADRNEAWIFEIYGGHQYAAMKMPTDAVAVFGNQFMIGTVDPADNENYLFSKELFETIKKAGTEVKENDKIHLAKSIAEPRGEYSNMRTWRGHRLLAPSSIDADYKNDEFYPLFYKPDAKVSPLKVMDIFRDRYEDTEFDMNKSGNEKRRPIGTPRQSQIHIMQVMKDMPKETSTLMWLAMGNAEHSVFVPFYSGITKTPKAYRVDGEDYDKDGAYWKFKRICGIGASDRALYSKGIKDFWKAQEEKMYESIMAEKSNIKKAFKKGNKAGSKYVNKLGFKYANRQLKNSEELFSRLLSVFINNQNDRPDKKNVFK